MAFVKVAQSDEIPVGRGILVERDGRAMAIFNAGQGRFFACGASCPHEDGPLADGWLEGDVVVCPWHGFDFDLATGRCGVDVDLSIPVYRVRVSAHSVEVDLP